MPERVEQLSFCSDSDFATTEGMLSRDLDGMPTQGNVDAAARGGGYETGEEVSDFHDSPLESNRSLAVDGRRRSF